MVYSIKSLKSLEKAIERLPQKMREGFNASDWLQTPGHIALVNAKDVALFEQKTPGVYQAHWLFKSRGKEAFRSAKKLVEAMFLRGATKIGGLTPKFCVAARAFNRRFAYKHGGLCLGIVPTEMGEQELFLLKQKDYRG